MEPAALGQTGQDSPKPTATGLKAAWQPLALIAIAWAWAIHSCMGFWRDLEQYSYGWFVPALAGYFAWRRITAYTPRPEETAGLPERSGGMATKMLVVLALAVLPLEFMRLAIPASRQIVWVISLAAIATTLATVWMAFGRRLARELIFPLFFFLSACPWFSAVESPVTIGLMNLVTQVIMEILHFMGIQAVAKGTTIELANGTLGIEEACSGIRSLQSGTMYGLAIGELFSLTIGRRIGLMAGTVTIAFLLNVTRTLILSLQANKHGLDIIEKIHDQVGIMVSLVLPVLLYLLGRMLGPKDDPLSPAAEAPASWAPPTLAQLTGLGKLIAIGFVGWLPCHLWLVYQEMTIVPQKAPYFQVKSSDPANEKKEVEAITLKTLNPSSGGYIHHKGNDLPYGQADGFYFFWEPSKDNFNLLWHHPEVCMTAAGWKRNGEATEVKLTIDGHELTFLAYPFVNSRYHMIQLWGGWRNGEAVIGNDLLAGYSWKGSLAKLKLFSRGLSATEIISLGVPYKEGEPPIELAKRALTNTFSYNPPPKTVLK